MLPAFTNILFAIVILALASWAYRSLIPQAKLNGSMAIIVNVVAVVTMTIAVLWYVLMPLFSLLFALLGNGGFRGN